VKNIKHQVPCHRIPCVTGLLGQYMLVFQLLIWVVSAVEQTAITEEKISRKHLKSIIIEEEFEEPRKINLGVTKVTYFKAWCGASIQKCVFKFQISVTNFLEKKLINNTRQE